MTDLPPVVLDLTYVAARLGAPTPTGIERVDAAFARHLIARRSADRGHEACAIHYGLAGPHRLSARSAQRLVADAATAWRPAGGSADDPVYNAVAAWLRGPPAPLRRSADPASSAPGGARQRLRWRLAHDPAARVPSGAVYLNVAQYAFEYPHFFRWLEHRPDITPVFFIHDLLPLDHPEFFRDGYRDLFERRVATMARFARAAIVSGPSVGARVAAEMARRGRDPFPILSAPLPPPAFDAAQPAGGPDAPYFLMIGTIEPRKNHLLLLHAWRSLVERGGPVPRLVLVGARGWENEQTIDLLERSTVIRPHVAEVAGISTPGLSRLIAGARAVLVPSFAEGYGLPLAEALAAGTPAVAADIPVFGEVSQGCATLLDPTDGPAWRQAVLDLCDLAHPRAAAARRAAAAFRAPRWPAYFEELDRFLSSLVRSPRPAP